MRDFSVAARIRADASIVTFALYHHREPSALISTIVPLCAYPSFSNSAEFRPGRLIRLYK